MIGGLTYFVTEAWLNLWRGRGAAALSILTIGVAIFVLGLFLLVGGNVRRTVDRWSQSAEVSIYLRDDASDADRAAITDVLRRDGSVASVEPVSKSAALERFRKSFPELAPASDLVGGNPLPASFEVRLKPEAAGAAALERVSARVAPLRGVADVRYDRRWLDRLVAVGNFIRWTGLALAAVLVLAAGLTVANVVRLSLHARRDEIDIMELVGAPIAFIRLPFVCEGIMQGGIGAALGVAVLELTTRIAAPRLASMAAGLVELGPFALPSAWTAAGLIAGGMLVGCLGGLVASRGRG